MQFPSYDSFEPSGVEWLGDIPHTWEVRKLRFVGNAIIGLIYEPSQITNEGAGTLVLRASNIQGAKLVHRDNVYVDAEVPKKLKLQINDVLICSRNGSRELIGKNGKVTEDFVGATFGAFNTVFRSKYNDYIYHVLNSSLFEYQSGSFLTSTINQLTIGTLNTFKIPFPPIDEQQKITEFLDYKIQQIDQLIEKKKSLIEKLEEKRIAVITQAVTKGLDKNVKLKPSGVDWLSDVPEHWDVRALKFCCDFLNNRRIPLSAEERTGMEQNYPYYGASGIIDHVEDYIYDEPTVLIAEDGANLLSRSTDLAFIATGKYWVNNHAHILKPLDGEFDFWANLLCIVKYEPWVTGSAQPKLSKENLGLIPLPYPPLSEQGKISEHIKNELTKIEPMKRKASNVVARLEEYRSAIITSAVTGKIDVRDVEVAQGAS